jgi:hypothetical protein
MWMIEPSLMCKKHLLGEHCEIHMFVGALNKGISIQGYIDKSLLEIHNLKLRHELLMKEMKKRGMKHRSRLPTFKEKVQGSIDKEKNMIELSTRCEECRKLQLKERSNC